MTNTERHIMHPNRLSLPTILLSAVTLPVLMLLAAVLWLSPARSAEAVSTAPILSSSYDLWQAGKLTTDRYSGLQPDAHGAVTADIQLGELMEYTSTVGVVGAAPLTTTVGSARIMIYREPRSDATGSLELAVCEGRQQVSRVLSVAPIALESAPEFVWIDIPLVKSASELTVLPAEYLCWTGARTSAGFLDVKLVLQAAVRYWAAPTDYIYLPDIKQ